jgi:hemerythrin-like domain-containing protein
MPHHATCVIRHPAGAADSIIYKEANHATCVTGPPRDNEGMPVVIGGKPQAHYSDPIGLLTDCHRRIERFLDALARVAAEDGGRELSAGHRASLETALRYFREAAPKHTADEEKTLFPRLRACGRPEIDAMLARVETLEHEHVRADVLHAEVDRLGQKWLTVGALPSDEAARHTELLDELVLLYRDHIALEEGVVFPQAANILEDADRKAMGEEMEARRRA